MEASSTVHRCLWKALARPVRCRHLVSRQKSSSQSTSRPTTRSSLRTFTSTSHNRQDTPPQPKPVSRNKSVEDAVGIDPRIHPLREQIPQPDPNKRIDLSSLPGIPDSYIPPGGRRPPTTKTASAKLDALFSNPSSSENPFDRTVRQTDALNNNKGTLDLRSLLQDLELTGKGGIDTDTDVKHALRLKPTLGRTQAVDNNRGFDLTRAFRMLEIKCSTNSVRRDMVKQKFHVRRGQRRKLERSLRWRQAFKQGFLEECARVRRMKNQGW